METVIKFLTHRYVQTDTDVTVSIYIYEEERICVGLATREPN